MGARRLLALAAAAVSLVAAGCGEDDPGSGDSSAVELTRWLPRDEEAFTVADFTSIKEEAGLEEEEDPLAVSQGLSGTIVHVLGAFLEPSSERDVTTPLSELPLVEAIDPAAVTSGASAQQAEDRDLADVAVLATTTDTGEVGSALGDLGYRDEGGILIPAEPSDGPSVRLMEHLIFASPDPAVLAALPDEPAEEPPMQALVEVEDFPDVIAHGFAEGCVREIAIGVDPAEAIAEIAMLIEGDAEASRFEPDGSDLVTNIETDGSLLVAEVEREAGDVEASMVQTRLFPGYDCG